MTRQLIKRISFRPEDASHLYELALEHFCDGDHGCSTCSRIKERLEKFIGPEEVKGVTRTIKRNGYCNKLKK